MITGAVYKLNTGSSRARQRKPRSSFAGGSPWVWLTSLVSLLVVAAPIEAGPQAGGPTAGGGSRGPRASHGQFFIPRMGDAVSCDFPKGISTVRPNPKGVPTPVSVGLYVNDVERIENVKQSFQIDFVLLVRWKDPRLESGARPLCIVKLDAIWHPDLLIVNEELLVKDYPDELEVEPDGTVFYVQRFTGTLSVPLDLRNFPFDRQALSIKLLSGRHSADELLFDVNKTYTDRSETFTIADWSIGPPTADVEVFYFAPLATDFSLFVYRLEARRHPFYYFLKIVFPLTMIILMSWVVFWLNPSHLGTQLGLSASIIVILGIFQLSLLDLLPRVPYMTRMDHFLLVSQILVFVALLESVTSGVVAERNPALAQRLDWWSRCIFPTAFVVLVLFAFLV